MKNMSLQVLTSTAALLLTLLASTSASAAPMLESLPTFSSLSSRLELTEEQQKKLAPVFDRAR